MIHAVAPSEGRARLGEPLTAREEEMVALLAQGWTDKQIARRCFISVDTVKTHLKHVYRKLGANGRTHAVGIAYRTGVLPVVRRTV